jgi:site-specific recombinase XerC
MAAPQSDPMEAIIGYSQKRWGIREVRMITAISTASGRKKTIVESRAAINHKPHHDIRPPKMARKKPRIIG